MSLSSDRSRALRTAVAGVGVGLVMLPVAAIAGAPDGLIETDGPASPVRDISAPVLDLATTVESTDGSEKVEKKPTKVTITLDSTVLFGKDSAVLTKAATARIADAADELRGRKPGTVVVTGYTDDLGTAEHGLVLSRQRARAVAGVLATRLPSSYRLKTVGKGEADPAVPNTSEANRRKNRRVVITSR